MHKPHSRQRYVELFRDSWEKRNLYTQGELHGLMLGDHSDFATAVDNDELHGEVYRFVKVDASEPWFNMMERRQATPSEVDRINIPPHLLAHMQRIPFIFYPSQHELWFISKDGKDAISSGAMHRLFQSMFEATCEAYNYPPVEVTVIPAAEAVDELLSVPRLRHVTLSFKRPNGDDGEEEELELIDRMEDQGVRTMTEEMSAGRGGSIKPDEKTVRRAKIAARNGSVAILGNDALGMPIDQSTLKKPMRIFAKVNAAMETAVDVLRRYKP